MPGGKNGSVLFRRPETFEPVTYVGLLHNSAGVASGMMPHAHPFALEICYVTDGHLDWWAGEEPHQLRPGDLMVILPREAHGAADSAMQPCEYYWVHIDESAVDGCVLSGPIAAAIEGVHRSSAEIGDLVRRIFEEHRNPDERSPAACRSLVELLLIGLVRSATARDEPKVGELVKHAQEALLAEKADNPSVGEVAKRLGVSAVWLTRRFRSETGESPAQWVRGKRLAEAKELLGNEDVPVGEIAVRLGFSSSQYFATVFRREIGMTPSEYRELRLAKQDPPESL